MSAEARVFVTGHRGLVGTAVLRELEGRGYSNVLTRTREQLDLTDVRAVEALFAEARPEYVVLAAAKVGGIMAMATEPAEFLRENLLIQAAVMGAARKFEVERLLFLATAAMYPAECAQPMREEALGTGALEPTVRAYSMAKLAGVEMCRAENAQFGTGFLALALANLYGPECTLDPARAGVVASLLRKAHVAKRDGTAMDVWGTGEARRELLFAEDLAKAIAFLLEMETDRYAGLAAEGVVNVGVGEDVSIRELAEVAARVVGFAGEIRLDPTKPEGVMRKLLDVSRMRELGWRAEMGLEEGMARVYEAVVGRL